MRFKKILTGLLSAAIVAATMVMPAFADDFVAKIGDTNYDTLEDAIIAATADDVIVIGEGEYTTYGTSYAHGKTLTFEGAVDANGNPLTTWKYGTTYYVNGEGGSDYSFEGSNVTFKNIKFFDNYRTNSSHRGFVRLGSGVFENCEFNDMITYLGSNSATFKDCTFNAKGSNYALWIYGIKNITFDGCTMNVGNRFANAYIEGTGKGDCNIVVKDCTLNAQSSNKSAFNLKNSNNWDVTFLGENTISGLAADAKTGSAWFQSEAGSNTVKVSVGNTEDDAVVIWDGIGGASAEDAKTENYIAPEDFQPIAEEINAIAIVGDTGYETYAEAVNAAVASGQPVELVASELSLDDCSALISAINGKAVTVKGNGIENTTLNVNINGGHIFGTANATFKDLTIVSNIATDRYTASLNGKFDNVKFVGQITTCNYNSEFTNCIFDPAGYNYALWVYSGTIKCDNCTFLHNNEKAHVKLYGEKGNKISSSFTGCNFEGTTRKACNILVSNLNSAASPIAYDVTVEDCTSQYTDYYKAEKQGSVMGLDEDCTYADDAAKISVIENGEVVYSFPKDEEIVHENNLSGVVASFVSNDELYLFGAVKGNEFQEVGFVLTTDKGTLETTAKFHDGYKSVVINDDVSININDFKAKAEENNDEVVPEYIFGGNLGSAFTIKSVVPYAITSDGYQYTREAN